MHAMEFMHRAAFRWSALSLSLVFGACPSGPPSPETRPPAPPDVGPPPEKEVVMHRDNVFVAAADQAGTRLVTGSVSGEVILWDVEPFAARLTLAAAGTGKVGALAMSPAGDVVTWVIDWRSEVVVASGDGLQVRNAVPGHTGRVTALAIGNDGMLAIGGADRLSSEGGASGDDEIPRMGPPTVRLVTGGRVVHELAGLSGRITALVISGDGRRVAGGGEGRVIVWDVATGGVLETIDAPGQTASITLARETCVATSDGAFCSGPSGRREFAGARAPTLAAAMSSDGALVATGTYDATEIRRVGLDSVVSVPGRAYAIVPVGASWWAIQVDRALIVRDGRPTGDVRILRAPEP